MKLFDLMKDVKYTISQGNNTDITTIVIDSRKSEKGCAFICIDGLHVDGHQYIAQAVNAGATAVIVTRDIEEIVETVTVVKVENSRAALSLMAGNFYHWPSCNYPLIGVTGTNGKTSCTYFLEAIFNEYGHKTGVIGTVSTRVGSEEVKTKFATSTTPDPIELQQIFVEMKDEGVDAVVMEVTSHALELYKIEGLKFDVSIFTNLTQDHLDLHGSMDNYSRQKAKLFKISDIAVVNIDNEYGQFMADSAAGRVVTFSIDKASDLKAENVTFTSHGVSFDLYMDETIHFEVPIPGKFTVYNALGVIGAALNYGVPIETVQKALENLKGVPGRIQSVCNNQGIGVYIDYAHTPDSLKNIISAVREFTKGNVITVFGCGGDRDKTKRPIMGGIAASLSDYCVITSDNPRTEDPAQIVEEVEAGVKPITGSYTKIVDRKEAIQYAIHWAKKQDSVIIAGKGHENYQIFADKTIHFDDAEVAAEILDREEENV